MPRHAVRRRPVRRRNFTVRLNFMLYYNMRIVLKDLIEKLKNLFEKYNNEKGSKDCTRIKNVKFAYLYGSLAQGLDTSLSDIDVAVYLKGIPSLDEELDLHLFMSRGLATDRVDLLILNRTRNIMLLEEIIKKGIVIYDTDPEFRLDFELRVLHEAIDFKEHRRAILGR